MTKSMGGLLAAATAAHLVYWGTRYALTPQPERSLLILWGPAQPLASRLLGRGE